MKRMFTLVITGIALTACGNNPVSIKHKGPLIKYARYNVGISPGEIDSRLDGSNVDQFLLSTWAEQQGPARYDDAAVKAALIARGCPDVVDFSISVITIPEYAEAESGKSDQRTEGYIAAVLEELTWRGLAYVVQGTELAREESFQITLPDGTETEAIICIMEYTLMIVKETVQQSGSAVTQSAGPRWDPPVRLEKRAGSKPGG
ncbi:hypothetical protein ACFL6T_01445 [Candidatus Zixiibacteriota bacterium]